VQAQARLQEEEGYCTGQQQLSEAYEVQVAAEMDEEALASQLAEVHAAHKQVRAPCLLCRAGVQPVRACAAR
jgi:hypothetical protein